MNLQVACGNLLTLCQGRRSWTPGVSRALPRKRLDHPYKSCNGVIEYGFLHSWAEQEYS